MTIEIDLHVHTVHSGSARMTVADVAREAERRTLDCVTITDSGSVEGVREMLLRESTAVLPGLELATEEGHFLVFCPDLPFLDTLGSYLRSIAALPARDDVAVVWAHPWAYTPDGSRRAPLLDEPLSRAVLPHVHGVEVCNGNMAQMLGGELLAKNYVEAVTDLALASGKALVGGSDAHDPDRFFTCWTEVVREPSGAPGDVRAAEVIRAIRRGQTRPRTSLPDLAARLAASLGA